jgi:hypothetical protein
MFCTISVLSNFNRNDRLPLQTNVKHWSRKDCNGFYYQRLIDKSRHPYARSVFVLTKKKNEIKSVGFLN